MQTIGTGRYLCMLYYRGELKPSCFYEPESAEWLLSRCVEIPLEGSGSLANFWRLLMSGDLQAMPAKRRTRLTQMAAGGRAKFTGVLWKGEPIENCESVGGSSGAGGSGEEGKGISIGEIILYMKVGEQFVNLIESKN